MSFEFAEGFVTAGHGVASGRSGDPRFPHGTIALQLPVFLARGVDIAALLGAEPFPGTINLDIAPRRPRPLHPEIELREVTWSPVTPAETFWLFAARLRHSRGTAAALIYMPDPATKPEHFQADTVVEIIAAPISPSLLRGPVAIAADRRHLAFT